MLVWNACSGAGGALNCIAVGGGGRGRADRNELSIVARTRWYTSRSEREMGAPAVRELVAVLVCRFANGCAGGGRGTVVGGSTAGMCG